MGNQLISMKKGKGKEVCFVFLFSLPQRMEGADIHYFVNEQGFLVKATRLNGWRSNEKEQAGILPVTV